MTNHPPQRGNARQRSKLDTRTRLLEAAAEHFASNGSQKTTIAMVAERAGVAVGTVYLHFPDKTALLEAVLTEALAALKRCLATAASGQTARTAAQDVRQRTDGLVGFGVEHPRLAAVLFDPASLGTPVGRDILAFLNASQAAGLEAGQQRGWYRRDLSAALAAPVLVGGIVLAMDAWLRGGGRTGARPEAPALAAALADLRLRGIGV
jgi:AcrR family transcriptional regulator